MKNVYLVTAGRTVGTTFNKSVALRSAKAMNGQVHRMSYQSYRDGDGGYGWDAPTFKLCGEKIADFTYTPAETARLYAALSS